MLPQLQSSVSLRATPPLKGDSVASRGPWPHRDACTIKVAKSCCPGCFLFIPTTSVVLSEQIHCQARPIGETFMSRSARRMTFLVA